jgi:membrane dipeptidase
MPETASVPGPRIDGHLDLAFNAVAQGRDLDLDLDALRAHEGRTRETAMVTWPELRRAGVDAVIATLYAQPHHRVPMQPGGRSAPPSATEPAGYRDAQGAFEQAEAQLRYYERLEARGDVRIVRTSGDLRALSEERRRGGPATPLGVVLLMEGADPIRTPDEVSWWWQRGVRLVGLAWQGTRYAGGTRSPGPLTDLGRELVAAMDACGMALDVSHLADASLWEALERFRGPVAATHANARALTPTDRHLDDDALRALAARDAVVGVVLGAAFLDLEAAREGRPVTLAAVRAHASHIASLVGWDRVGIGSDLDGGFGMEETPVELRRGADFAALAAAVPTEHVSDFLGGAWWRWLERSLPR